jgi:hypothetical protein
VRINWSGTPDFAQGNACLSFVWASQLKAKSDPAEAAKRRRRTSLPDGIRTNLSATCSAEAQSAKAARRIEHVN